MPPPWHRSGTIGSSNTRTVMARDGVGAIPSGSEASISFYGTLGGAAHSVQHTLGGIVKGSLHLNFCRMIHRVELPQVRWWGCDRIVGEEGAEGVKCSQKCNDSDVHRFQ